MVSPAWMWLGGLAYTVLGCYCLLYGWHPMFGMVFVVIGGFMICLAEARFRQGHH